MTLKLQEHFEEGDKVEVSYKEDDGGGWYYTYKNKKGVVQFDKYGFYVTTAITKHIRLEDIMSIKKLTRVDPVSTPLIIRSN